MKIILSIKINQQRISKHETPTNLIDSKIIFLKKLFSANQLHMLFTSILKLSELRKHTCKIPTRKAIELSSL